MNPTERMTPSHSNTFDLEPEVGVDWYLLRKSWRLAQMMCPLPTRPPCSTVTVQHARRALHVPLPWTYVVGVHRCALCGVESAPGSRQVPMPKLPPGWR